MTKNFFAQTTPAIRRLHRQFARTFEVVNFTWDATAGSNEYADGGWTESSTTAPVTLRSATQSEHVTEAEGSDVEADVVLYASPDDVSVSLGTADESRATEFVDSQTGHTYRTVDVFEQDSLHVIEAERL